MNVTLVKGLVALVPTCMLFSGSVVLFLRGRNACSFLQLLGAGCLVVVVVTHLCEALHLFPWMHWGLEHSVGHYVDFWSAALGLTLFPIGYLFHVRLQSGTLKNHRPRVGVLQREAVALKKRLLVNCVEKCSREDANVSRASKTIASRAASGRSCKRRKI